MKIRKGDRVVVMAGKDRGATGRVMKADPERERVLVEGANKIKRHEKVRQTQRGGRTGGIIEREAWMHVSNVQIVSPGDSKPTRVSYRIDENGTKRRVCARTGAEL